MTTSTLPETDKQLAASFWVRNLTGGKLRLTDLKLNKYVDELIMESGEAMDLLALFPVESVRFSQSIRTAIKNGYLKVLKNKEIPTKESDMRILSDADVLRARLEKIVEEPPKFEIENGKAILDFPNGLDPILLEAANRFVGAVNEYDRKYDNYEKREEYTNLQLAGRVQVRR